MADSPTDAPLTVEDVFRDYAPRIYFLARRLLGNDADAEDITQEVLMQVLRKLDTFRGESTFPTWLHRITVNAALSHRRKRKVRDDRAVTQEVDTIDNGQLSGPVRRWGVSPEQAILDQETNEVLERAIASLPETYRDVYVLADVEGLPNQDVAEMLELSLPAVKSRLHRARLMLRDTLAPYFEEAAV